MPFKKRWWQFWRKKPKDKIESSPGGKREYGLGEKDATQQLKADKIIKPIVVKSKGEKEMPLSDEEIKSLLEKADHAWDSWCYSPIEYNIRYAEEALEAFNQIIGNTPPHPHYFMKRARIKSALASRRDGYLEGAVEDMNKAIEIEKAIPDDASYWQAKGDTLINLKRYEEALNAYEKTIELKPDCAEAWENKGDILKKIFGRYEESYHSYYKAAEYYLKSTTNDRFGERNRDIRNCFDEIIETYIFHIPLKYEDRKLQTELNAGNVSIELREFFKENKYPLSERVKVEQIDENLWRIKDENKVYTIHYQQFSGLYIHIENDPPHAYHYVQRAIFWNAIDIPVRAIGDMDRAIELDPHRGEYYRYRGELLLKKFYEDDKRKRIPAEKKKSFFEKVITDYKTSLEKNPSDPEIWLNLMELNILLHNWDDAISIYGSCRPYINSKEDKLVRSWLGCLALALAGDPIEEEDKRPLYDQTIRFKYTSEMMLRIISDSFINEIQEKEEYKEKWRKAIEIHKLFIEHLDDWEDRGDLLEILRCYKEAVEAYNRAIGLKPDRARRIYEKKGDILNKFLKHYEEALQAYDRAIELGGKDYHIWYEKAELLTILERYEEALNAFNKVEELNSGFFSYCHVWVDQGRVLEKLGRYEEALKIYDANKAWYFKGIIFKKLNAYDEAIRAFDKAIEVNPDYYHYRYTVADAWYGKASTYSLKNDRENTIDRLSKAIELDPKYKEDAKKDEDFRNLWEDEDFKRIVE